MKSKIILTNSYIGLPAIDYTDYIIFVLKMNDSQRKRKKKVIMESLIPSVVSAFIKIPEVTISNFYWPPIIEFSDQNELEQYILHQLCDIDTCIMVNQFIIIKQKVIDAFATKKITFLNIHPGKLPNYPGLFPIVRSLITEDCIGITLHIVLKDIDSGPIVYTNEKKVCNIIEARDFYIQECKYILQNSLDFSNLSLSQNCYNESLCVKKVSNLKTIQYLFEKK